MPDIRNTVAGFRTARCDRVTERFVFFQRGRWRAEIGLVVDDGGIDIHVFCGGEIAIDDEPVRRRRRGGDRDEKFEVGCEYFGFAAHIWAAEFVVAGTDRRDQPVGFGRYRLDDDAVATNGPEPFALDACIDLVTVGQPQPHAATVGGDDEREILRHPRSIR